MGVTRIPTTLAVVLGSAGALDPVGALDAVGGGAFPALLSGVDAQAQSGIVSRIAQGYRFIILSSGSSDNRRDGQISLAYSASARSIRPCVAHGGAAPPEDPKS